MHLGWFKLRPALHRKKRISRYAKIKLKAKIGGQG